MRLFLACAAALVFTLPALPQKIDEAALDRIVESTRQAWNAPGISVAVVKNDQVVYLKAFGVKDNQTSAPLTVDSRLAIGSTTKAFTTTALAILAGEKKLAWDDPVRRHLPEFRLSDPLANELVTLRDIVSHRTGLVRHDALWYGSPWDRAELIRRAGYLPLARPIRATYQYQNLMFLAAGEALARTAGTTYEDFVTRRILQPLGMTNTDFSAKDVVKSPDYATPHIKSPAGKVIQTAWRNLDNIAPAGAINSSARDMARWLSMQMNGGLFNGKRVVDETQLLETHAPQMVIRDDAQSRELNPETSMNVYGLAWRLQDYRGMHLVSHGGAIDGFRAQVAFLPKEKLGLVVLTNLGGNNLPEALRFALFDQMLALPAKDWAGLYLAAAKKTGDAAKKRIAEREAKRFKDTKPSRSLDAYAARYECPAYGVLEITFNEGALHAAWGNTKLKLEHFHFDTFQGPPSSPGGAPRELVFRLDGRGEPATVVFLEQEFKRAPK